MRLGVDRGVRKLKELHGRGDRLMMGEGLENICDMKGKVELLRAERNSSGEKGDGRQREPTQIKYS